MDLGIRGKKTLITGAGRGLGRSMAECLAREGAIIFGVSRQEKDLEELLKKMGGEKAGHRVFSLDLMPEGAPAQLVNELKSWGDPEIVVHNVGGNLGISDPFCSLEDWRRIQRFNVEIPIELNQHLIPPMQKKGWGRICHIASIAGLENQGVPAYCAAKAGLISYVRSVGRYVSKDGVIMTSVLPGAVFTEGGYWDEASRNRPEHVEKYLKERMAIQRFGTLDEIGNVVTFLCSEQASFCVGSAFLVDGGQGRLFYHQEGIL